MKREIQAYYLTFSQLHVYILQLFVELWVYILINLTNLYNWLDMVFQWSNGELMKIIENIPFFMCKIHIYIGSENTKRLKVCLWF